ncbi:MAG: hypothetical protein DI625_02125 [Sphingomonas sp.]|nr:MAG: hypothetical protein DI625_02125 [Sphingomonas sp.]
MSISDARKIGRPKVGSTPVNVRFPPAELAKLDLWIEKNPDITSRAEAVRRLVEHSLRSK